MIVRKAKEKKRKEKKRTEQKRKEKKRKEKKRKKRKEKKRKEKKRKEKKRKEKDEVHVKEQPLRDSVYLVFHLRAMNMLSNFVPKKIKWRKKESGKVKQKRGT